MPETARPIEGPLRSLLFVPANDGRKIAKAFASAADAVVLDLEDAIAVGEKENARRAAIQHLRGGRQKPTFVRVNALDTAFSLNDLMQVVEAAPEGILLPKVESRDMVMIADWLMAQQEAEAGLQRNDIELVPIVETARGLEAVSAIAEASPRVRRLAFGAVDLAADMDLATDENDLLLTSPRFAIAQASRANGREGPIDTAFIHVKERQALERSARHVRALGFVGKFCIHPDQIEIVNSAFTPSAEEVDRAARILAAFEAAEAKGIGAVAFEGMMLDYPVVAKARRILRSSG